MNGVADEFQKEFFPLELNRKNNITKGKFMLLVAGEGLEPSNLGVMNAAL